MSKLLSGRDMPMNILAVLQSIGLPKHATWVRITIDSNNPIEIECKFHPTRADGELARDDAGLMLEAKRFRIVAAE